MKNYALTVLFLCVSYFTTAQNINTSLAADINAKFAPLEKNRIPHNILLDYGFDLIDVAQFDGVLRTNNYIDVERYNLVYNSIVSSTTQLNVTGIAPPQQELNDWKFWQKQQNDIAKFSNKAAVVLNGLFFNYSKINANALSKNKIVVINDKYDDKYTNGVWQNPYDSKQAFAITSAVIMLNKSTVDVVLPATLWHTNASVTEIAIDFGNSTGYKILTNGVVASTTYTAVGVYTWTYRILTGGQYKYCRQKVKITQADTGMLARNTACGEPQVFTIPATKAYQGLFGSATIQVVRGGACNELRNPLIVAEGLDTGLLGQGGTIGDSDINSFFQSVDNSESVELENFLINNTAVDYDIIYVNWNNGTDFIQRNASVLEAVIKWVNDNKTGTNKNVVLGQSMGGLVARYALRDMENNGLNHDTSLYISHDVPHQGANIPLGILNMARHTVNEFIQTPLGNITIPVNGVGNVGLSTIDNLLDAPAINQMLLNTVDTNGNRTNTVHTTWQNELRLFGYPQQTRNIALSNASHCASGQGLVSNQELVTVTGNGGTSVLTSLLLYIFANVDPLIGVALNDTSASLLGFLPGNTKLDLEFRANAFPSTGTARIYKGRLTYEKKLLWLIPITRTIFNKDVNSQSGDKFIDNYPGGVTPNALAISENGGDNNLFYNYDYNLNVNLNFDFIPVTSALDVGSGNSILNDSDYFFKYTASNPPLGTKAIPFNNFTTSSNENSSLNAEHISFNRRNGDWLATELDNSITNNQVFDCTYVCSNTSITGADFLCTTSNYTAPAGSASYNWTITQGANLVSLSANGTANISVTAFPNVSGQVILSLIMGGSCGNLILTKTIWAGVPQIIGLTCPNESTICSGTFCKQELGLPSFDLTNNLEANVMGMTTSEMWERTNWEWERINTNIVIAQNTQGNEIYVAPNYIGQTGVRVRAKNNCGWSEWFEFDFEVVSCGSNLMRLAEQDKVFIVFPNPSNDIVNVDVKEGNSILAVDTKVSGELFDMMGNSRAKIKIKNKKASFNVNGLNKGVYVLKIYMDDKIESHQIGVK